MDQEKLLELSASAISALARVYHAELLTLLDTNPKRPAIEHLLDVFLTFAWFLTNEAGNSRVMETSPVKKHSPLDSKPV